MFSSTRKHKQIEQDGKSVYDTLDDIYQNIMLPVEENCFFHRIGQPYIEKGYFKANPMVMVVGQYSVGKSTFVTHLMGENYPDVVIGPEPTTDGFVIVAFGETPSVTIGNSLVADPSKPFASLDKFGNSFLNKLSYRTLNNELLRYVTFVDTPGILAGKDKTLSRGYNQNDVFEWFAERSDRILIMVDANKLDISDEFQEVIRIVKPYDSKIRILLNKADDCNAQALLRVYGALMWNLGRIVDSPEVPRVYVGSFWDKKLKNVDFKTMIEAEYKDLLIDLSLLPYQTLKRKVNDFLKRAKCVRIVAHLVEYLHNEMPYFGGESKKKVLIADLENIYKKVSNEFSLPVTDFPQLESTKIALNEINFTKLKPLSKNKTKDVADVIKVHLPRIIQRIDSETQIANKLSSLKHGAFRFLSEASTMDMPFTEDFLMSADNANNLESWVGVDNLRLYTEEFMQITDNSEHMTSKQLADKLRESDLKNSTLSNIYALAEPEGQLITLADYAIMRYLVHLTLSNKPLPKSLPDRLRRASS